MSSSRGIDLSTAQVAPEVWTLQRPLNLIGVDFGARMTIVRLKSGGLFLHSPIRLSSDTKEFCNKLGPVEYVIAPNTMHHLFISAYFTEYPAAIFLAPENLIKMLPNLKFTRALSHAAESGYQDVMEQSFVEGTRPKFDEMIFFHRPSRTLIVTDLLFNLPPPQGLWQKLFFSLNHMGDGPAPSRLMRFMLHDRVRVRRTVEWMLERQPENLILSHGNIVRGNASEVIKRAFAWL